MTLKTLAAATPLVLALTALGATGTAAVSSAASGKTTVNVRLTEWSIKPSPAKVPAGKVTFVVHNAGKYDHELVVIRTNHKPGQLPVDGGEASEKGSVGEIDHVKPGKTGRFTLTLKQGHYALICNHDDHGGHYMDGMHTAFVVK